MLTVTIYMVFHCVLLSAGLCVQTGFDENINIYQTCAHEGYEKILRWDMVVHIDLFCNTVKTMLFHIAH